MKINGKTCIFFVGLLEFIQLKPFACFFVPPNDGECCLVGSKFPLCPLALCSSLITDFPSYYFAFGTGLLYSPHFWF